MSLPAAADRYLKASFLPAWDPGVEDGGRRGFMAPDPRARTLLRVLVSYPEVRYVLPDARVLPYQGVCHGKACLAIPDNCGFTLIGNADRLDLSRPETGRR